MTDASKALLELVKAKRKADKEAEKEVVKAEKKAKKETYEALIAENKAATTIAKLNSLMDKLLKELAK